MAGISTAADLQKRNLIEYLFLRFIEFAEIKNIPEENQTVDSGYKGDFIRFNQSVFRDLPDISLLGYRITDNNYL